MNWKAIVKQVLSIEKMLVPVILLWIYRIGFCLIGLGMICYSFDADGFWQTLGIILLGTPLTLILWRVCIELIYVLFGIYTQLTEINANTRK